MLKIYKYNDLGHADHGWLNARHHFSFARYANRERMGFGALRVINDDVIAAHHGFGAHPHDNMEIITYVRQGAIMHADNLGNQGTTQAGEVQVMSAGSGVTHSEKNDSAEETRLYQIWIYPDKENVAPRWEQASFPQAPVDDALRLLVSGRDEDKDSGALYINQDAAIYGGRLKAGTSLSQAIKHQAYILGSHGSFKVNGETLEKGDGAEVSGTNMIQISAVTDAEILVIDVPA